MTCPKCGYRWSPKVENPKRCPRCGKWLIPKLIGLALLLCLAGGCKNDDGTPKLIGFTSTPVTTTNPPTTTPPPPPVPVTLIDHYIVLSGQSNMAGTYDKYPWPLQSNMHLLTGDDTGPGVYACNLIAKAHPTWRVNCLQTEVGGTAIATWLPGAVNYVRMMGMIHQYIPDISKIDAFIWYQGEADAIPTCNPNWDSQLTQLVASLRADLNKPGLPVIWTELAGMGFPDPVQQIQWDLFKSNQEQLILSAPSMMVKADGAPNAPGGGVHLGQDGHIIVGTRYFNAFQALVQ